MNSNNTRNSYWFWIWLVQFTMKKADSKNEGSIGELWHNLHIFSGANAEEAYEKAMAHGKLLGGDSKGSLTLNGKPARSYFLGISDMGLIHEELSDGCEILFRSRRCSLSSAKKLISKKNELTSIANKEIAHEKVE